MFDGQLVHRFFFSREVCGKKSNAISFNILGKKVTYALEDFILITDLWLFDGTIERLQVVRGYDTYCSDP